MQEFIHRKNLEKYRQLLAVTKDEAQRCQLEKLLAEEAAWSPLCRSRGTTASANRPVRRGHGPRSRIMAARRKPAEAPANRLLGLLPAADYRRLRRHLEPISLAYRQSLHQARQPLGFVYFIETGVGSLVNTMANGQAGRGRHDRQRGRGRPAAAAGRRPRADQRLRPGPRRRPAHDGGAVRPRAGPPPPPCTRTSSC